MTIPLQHSHRQFLRRYSSATLRFAGQPTRVITIHSKIMNDVVTTDTSIALSEPAISEEEWQLWLVTYAALRSKTFMRLLNADREKRELNIMSALANVAMQTAPNSPTVRATPGSPQKRLVTMDHRVSDPGTWIVREYTTFLWFKKRISSNWFNDEKQATAFADALRGQKAN